MKNLKIAVVTTCEEDFQRYSASQPKEVRSKLVKITFLKDIKHSEYSKAVLLIKSVNVTEFLIKKVTKISESVENLSNKLAYL
jgi:hypothetical protein